MADETPPLPPTAISEQPLNVPPIPLNPPPRTAPSASAPPTKKDAEIKDSFRELIETIVFVVVLVLMLKTFLAEAFVIPTGSMATTLLGYHYKIKCDQCNMVNLVNATYEAEPVHGKQIVAQCKCINCGNHIEVQRPELRENPR